MPTSCPHFCNSNGCKWLSASRALKLRPIGLSLDLATVQTALMGWMPKPIMPRLTGDLSANRSSLWKESASLPFYSPTKDQLSDAAISTRQSRARVTYADTGEPCSRSNNVHDKVYIFPTELTPIQLHLLHRWVTVLNDEKLSLRNMDARARLQ